MKFAFVKRLVPIAAIGVVIGAVAAGRAATAGFGGDGLSQSGASSTTTVRTVPPGTRLAGDPGKKGDTYYWIEGQTIRSTIRFGDTVVVADRRGDGKLHAKVTDRSGNERGDFTASSTLLQFRAPSGVSIEAQGLPAQSIQGQSNQEQSNQEQSSQGQSSQRHDVQAQNDSGEHLTLHWVAGQAYGLARDGTANLVWDGGVMRPRRAAKPDVDKEADELETVWANGLVAKLTKHDFPPHAIAPGRVVQGRAWVTTLTANGVPAGHSVWFERDQVFAYSLPGLTDGVVWIGPEHLKQQYGGWPFRPDVAWLSLQTIASHHFRTLIAKQGFVARKCDAPQPSRLAQFFFPTLSANEPGCDGLHYFDGTMVRQCCDDHDRCYAKNGCTSQSWWQFWRSWSCDFCNMAVVACFAVGSDMDPCRMRAWWGC